MKTRYVVGFLFNPELTKVVLIRKNKPDWQKGLLNGPGGKLKNGEKPQDAMYREYLEEAGLEILTWRFLGRLVLGDDAEVNFFTGIRKECLINSMEAEPCHWYSVAEIERLPVIPNLRWLIPFAKLKLQRPDWKEVGTFVTA